MSTNSFDDLTTNINWLALHRFKVQINRCPNVSFFCQEANLPGMAMGVAKQATPFVDVPVPGDKIQFENFVMTFGVDEDMTNYKEIASWIIDLGFPRSHTQFKNIVEMEDGPRTTITLHIFDSNYNEKHTVTFMNAFPVALSALTFDSKAETNIIPYATATFEYSHFEINSVGGFPVDQDPDQIQLG